MMYSQYTINNWQGKCVQSRAGKKWVKLATLQPSQVPLVIPKIKQKFRNNWRAITSFLCGNESAIALALSYFPPFYSIAAFVRTIGLWYKLL